jgi:hypothetical protein
MIRLSAALSASTLLGLALSGCCCPIELDLRPPESDDDGDRVVTTDDDDDRTPAPRARDGEVDLGTAEHPRGNRAEPALHPWSARGVAPSRHRLGYRLSDDSAREALGEFHGFARKVGHKKLDEHRFQWRPEPRCLGGLHCVYESLDGQDGDRIRPLAELFVDRARAADLDVAQATALVVTFVQHIRYEIPEEQPFGVLPPSLVVKEKRGDCDSKSLLAHMLLREIGVRSVLVSSQAHAHTMLAAALPAPGKSFTWRGTKFAFVETTAKNAPIGHMDPKLLRPNDWQVVDIRYDERGRGSSAEAGRTAVEAVPGGSIEIR